MWDVALFNVIGDELAVHMIFNARTRLLQIRAPRRRICARARKGWERSVMLRIPLPEDDGFALALPEAKRRGGNQGLQGLQRHQGRALPMMNDE